LRIKRPFFDNCLGRRHSLPRLEFNRQALMLDRIEKFNLRISAWCEWVGIAMMLLIVAITCIDVVGAKLFKWRILGAIDIVMLAQLVAIAFASGIAFIKGRHIKVEFFFKLLPRQIQDIVDGIVLLLGMGLFSVIIWRLCVLGYSFQTSGEYSATAHIPFYPFAYGVALASIPVWLQLLVQLVKILIKREPK
jgi:TRAP-type C4-dicarboxylate transport system permease small subunit